VNPVRLNRDRPKVPDLVPLILAVRSRPGGAVGCCLHVITDDPNYDCARWVLENLDPAHADCREAAEMMVQMTESQIARAVRRVWEIERSRRA